VDELHLTNVFEFGSGRSTKSLLGRGCHVTSLEDSQVWLQNTLSMLSPAERQRHLAFLQPLRNVLLGAAPLKSWSFDLRLTRALAEAQLVLIDSPAYPPFREHALAMSLTHARHSLIIVDDANIPTVLRFCLRLAEKNHLLHFHLPVDHGLFFILPPEHSTPLNASRSHWETMKAWRRFFLSHRSAQPAGFANHQPRRAARALPRFQ